MIYLTIGGIRNPRTMSTTNSFKLFLNTKSGLGLENATSNLTAQLFYTPEVPYFAVNSTNKTNGALANLTFNATTPVPMVSGDYITFDVPSEVQVFDNVSCTSGSKVGIQIACKKVGNVTVRVTFTNTTAGGSVYPAGANFSFRISGFKNPADTRWTSSFENITFFDIRGNVLAQYYSYVGFANENAGSVVNAKLT